MEAYERRMDALRSGAFVPPPDDGYDPNADLRALQSSHKRKPAERETYMSREQLQELRRVQAERVEVSLFYICPCFIRDESANVLTICQAGKMKLLGMDVKQNMGVRMDGTVFDE